MSPDGGGRLASTIYGAELATVPEPTFSFLRDLIVQRTGVYFDEPKRDLLADKLAELVTANGLTSFLDYYYLLRYDADAERHWGLLMDRLAVPETFFWRQSEHLRTVATVVAPSHFAAHPGRPLRIWSAACCTGEEPVSLAIALAEAGLLSTWPIEIVGSDGSAAMIARARQARYGERSFRQLPPELKAKYFVPAADGDGTFTPVKCISERIHYVVANLVRPSEIEPLASADIVFCRNVFIYFSDDAIRAVIRVLFERMPDEGYLFVGAAESLTRLSVDFELAEVGGSFLYVKTGRRPLVEGREPRTASVPTVRASTVRGS